MAERKEEGGSAPFITQTEGYGIENDLDRHSRNMQLQSKGFQEQLRSPQPSPYVHATERMSAIDTDSAALNTLGRGIDASLHLYEKYDKGPSIQEYLDDVHEITEAHRTGRIDDATYRREMRKARNAAENAYADDPRAMAKLKNFHSGEEYGEYKQYEATAWAVAQEYTKMTGLPCSPNDENFESTVIPALQKRAILAQKVETAKNELSLLGSKDKIEVYELKDNISNLSTSLTEMIRDYTIRKIDGNGTIDDADVEALIQYAGGVLLGFQNNPQISRHLDDPYVRSQFEKFKTVNSMIGSLKDITDHKLRMQKFQEISAFMGIKNMEQQMQIRGDKASLDRANAIQNLINFATDKNNKYPFSVAVGAAKAYFGDKSAVQDLAKRGRNGDNNSAFYGLNAGLNFNDDGTAVSAMLSTPVFQFYNIKNERNYEEQASIKEGVQRTWENTIAELDKLGAQETMFNGKNTMLRKQLRFKGLNSDGLNIQPLAGASPEAKKLARTANDFVTKTLISRSFCTSNTCDFKKLAKNPDVIKYIKEMLKGVADG